MADKKNVKVDKGTSIKERWAQSGLPKVTPPKKQAKKGK